MLPLIPLNVRSPSDMRIRPCHHRRDGPRALQKVAYQPPRLLRQPEEILGHPPYYLQSPVDHPIPSQPHIHAAQSYPPTGLNIHEPQLIPTPVPLQPTPPLTSPPSPAPYMTEATETQVPVFYPTTPLPPNQFPYAVPSPTVHPHPLPHNYTLARQAGPHGYVVHPAPRRPITLSGIKGPLSPPLPPNLHEQRLLVQADIEMGQQPQVPFDQADYLFDLRLIFREGSRFLPHTVIENSQPHTPMSRTDELSTLTPVCPCAATYPCVRRYGDDVSQCPNRAAFIQVVKQHYSCIADYGWVESVMMRDTLLIDYIYSGIWQARDKYGYRTGVRTWLLENTGLTFWEMLKNAFQDTRLYDDTKFTPSYIWMVLLVRQALISFPYAQHLGVLIRLGASDLDPCHPSFRFSSLRNSVWELVEGMAFKYLGRWRNDTFIAQQRAFAFCGRGHLHVTMAETHYSALHYQPLPKHPDTTEYTCAFRECFLRILNQNDEDGVGSAALARCLHLPQMFD